MKYGGKLLRKAILGALVIASITAAQAAKPIAPQASTSTEIALVSDTSIDLGQKAVEFQKIAKEIPKGNLKIKADTVLNRLASGDIPVHLAPGASLLDGEIGGYDLPEKKSVVQVPIRGAHVVAPSNLSVFLDAHHNVLEVIEIQYTADPTNSNRGRVTRWDGGQLRLDKMVTADGELSDPTTAAPARMNVQRIKLVWSWSKFNDCLSSHGIAAWVIVAIGAACGVACAGTLGIGCAVCISAIGGISAGVVTNCIKRARD